MLLNVLQKEKQKQRRAEAYYDEHYIKYFCNDKLFFTGEVPNYVFPPINKIEENYTENEIDFVCRRENGSFISPSETVSNFV